MFWVNRHHSFLNFALVENLKVGVGKETCFSEALQVSTEHHIFITLEFTEKSR